MPRTWFDLDLSKNGGYLEMAIVRWPFFYVDNHDKPWNCILNSVTKVSSSWLLERWAFGSSEKLTKLENLIFQRLTFPPRHLELGKFDKFQAVGELASKLGFLSASMSSSFKCATELVRSAENDPIPYGGLWMEEILHQLIGGLSHYF